MGDCSPGSAGLAPPTTARRGTLDGAVKIGATFADASAAWFRYVEHDRKRQASTVADYRCLLRVGDRHRSRRDAQRWEPIR